MLSINKMGINQPVLISIGTFVIIFLASILLWIMFLGTIFLYFFGKKIKKETLVESFIAGVNAWGVSSIVKLLIPSIRPFILEGSELLTTTHHLDNSFPSSHSALSFAIATSIFIKNKPIGILYYMGALLVSVGRVASNAHFPVDTLGGAMIGIFVSLLVNNISQKTLKKV